MQKKDLGIKNKSKSAPINENIKGEKFQTISSKGENLGVLKRNEVFNMAETEGLDVVLISEKNKEGIPVVKILNYNKKLYEEKKKLIQSKKKQHEVQLKELRLSLKIGKHDLDIKLKKAKDFLADGHRVKFFIMVRGRERELMATIGKNLFSKVEEGLSNFADLNDKALIVENYSSNAKLFYFKKK